MFAFGRFDYSEEDGIAPPILDCLFSKPGTNDNVSEVFKHTALPHLDRGLAEPRD